MVNLVIPLLAVATGTTFWQVVRRGLGADGSRKLSCLNGQSISFVLTRSESAACISMLSLAPGDRLTFPRIVYKITEEHRRNHYGSGLGSMSPRLLVNGAKRTFLTRKLALSQGSRNILRRSDVQVTRLRKVETIACAFRYELLPTVRLVYFIDTHTYMYL